MSCEVCKKSIENKKTFFSLNKSFAYWFQNNSDFNEFKYDSFKTLFLEIFEYNSLEITIYFVSLNKFNIFLS